MPRAGTRHIVAVALMTVACAVSPQEEMAEKAVEHPTGPPSLPPPDDGGDGNHTDHPASWNGPGPGGGSTGLEFVGSSGREYVLTDATYVPGDHPGFRLHFRIDGTPWTFLYRPVGQGFIWVVEEPADLAFEMSLWTPESWADRTAWIEERTRDEWLLIKVSEVNGQRYEEYHHSEGGVIYGSDPSFPAWREQWLGSSSQLESGNCVAGVIAAEILVHPAFAEWLPDDRQYSKCKLCDAITHFMDAAAITKCTLGGPANPMCDLLAAEAVLCHLYVAALEFLEWLEEEDPETPDPPDPPSGGGGGGRSTAAPWGEVPWPLWRVTSGVPIGEVGG